MSNDSEMLRSGGQFLVYQTQDGKLKIDVRFEGETVWLTHQHMAELFQTSVSNVSMHIRNVFAEGELRANSVVKESRRRAAEESRPALRLLRGTDPSNPGHPDLRAPVLPKITDIYATSIDYDPTQEISIRFFQTVQNKVHWAITGQTAAEIVHERVAASKPNLGLTNWRGATIRKHDVAIAKNYLTEPELAGLNNLVEQYLIFAQGQAMRRVPMHMVDWIKKLDAFLTLTSVTVSPTPGASPTRWLRSRPSWNTKNSRRSVVWLMFTRWRLPAGTTIAVRQQKGEDIWHPG